MPRAEDNGKPKSEMIREVLASDQNLATPSVQAAVWDRFGGEVTAQEIGQVRKKMRQSVVAQPKQHLTPKPRSVSRRTRRKSGARKKAGPIRANDFDAAEVTVKQLSAILEVAEQVGGLRRLNDALQTVVLLREKVGAVDERQLVFALDFLSRVTGRK
jgi:hypothetical protein